MMTGLADVRTEGLVQGEQTCLVQVSTFLDL
jgi:hypothetical protein